MTAAVCIFCGAMKVGAWTPCDECGHMPKTETEWIKALACTDHYHDAATLERLAGVIRRGGEVTLDAESTANLRRMLRSEPLRSLAAGAGLQFATTPEEDAHTSDRPAHEWEFWKQPAQDGADSELEDGHETALRLDAEGLEAVAEKDLERAESLFSAAIEADGEYWEPWHHRGKTYLSTNRFRRATVDLTRALALAPEDSHAAILNDRGIAKRKAGDIEGALADYDAALGLSPDVHRIYLNRGIARLELGDQSGACADFQRARNHGVRGADIAARKAGCAESRRAASLPTRSAGAGSFRDREQSTQPGSGRPGGVPRSKAGPIVALSLPREYTGSSSVQRRLTALLIVIGISVVAIPAFLSTGNRYKPGEMDGIGTAGAAGALKNGPSSPQRPFIVSRDELDPPAALENSSSSSSPPINAPQQVKPPTAEPTQAPSVPKAPQATRKRGAPAATTPPGQLTASTRQSPRPPNGSVLQRSGDRGLSVLRVTNGTGNDAALLLESNEASIALYIWSGHQASVEFIRAGGYRARFMLGSGFDNDHFVNAAGFSEFDSAVQLLESQLVVEIQ